jgi:hypothetical protein
MSIANRVWWNWNSSFSLSLALSLSPFCVLHRQDLVGRVIVVRHVQRRGQLDHLGGGSAHAKELRIAGKQGDGQKKVREKRDEVFSLSVFLSREWEQGSPVKKLQGNRKKRKRTKRRDALLCAGCCCGCPLRWNKKKKLKRWMRFFVPLSLARISLLLSPSPSKMKFLFPEATTMMAKKIAVY